MVYNVDFSLDFLTWGCKHSWFSPNAALAHTGSPAGCLLCLVWKRGSISVCRDALFHTKASAVRSLSRPVGAHFLLLELVGCKVPSIINCTPCLVRLLYSWCFFNCAQHIMGVVIAVSKKASVVWHYLRTVLLDNTTAIFRSPAM